VVAARSVHVAATLPLLLVLVQRAVAAVDAEARPEPNPSAVAVFADEPAEQSRGEAVVEVQAGNARIGRRRRAEIERQHVYLVLEPAEAYVGGHVRTDRAIEPERETLVLDLRGAAERHQLL